MYTQEHVISLSQQKKKRQFISGVVLAVPLIVLVVSLFARLEWLTILSSIVFFVLLILLWDLFVGPVARYLRFVKDAVTGRGVSTQGRFKTWEEGISKRKGVNYRSFLINVGDMAEEEDDRLYYFDANLPTPDWKHGDSLTVISSEKNVVEWQSD
jgi:hypothetical protein